MTFVKLWLQVLQLAPSQRPGYFNAWVIADRYMYKVPIKVPRVFYLNTRSPNKEEYPGVLVNRLLPHQKPSFNLLEVRQGWNLLEFSIVTLSSLQLQRHPDLDGIRCLTYNLITLPWLHFCCSQVVVDEALFKDARRMLAAHLADPEVEVF